MTTVQDYPGRLGYWHVGVPPSGPMDSLSFRLGNRLLGNEEGAPGLECTLTGPSLRFHFETDFVLAGADFAARLDDAAGRSTGSDSSTGGLAARTGRMHEVREFAPTFCSAAASTCPITSAAPALSRWAGSAATRAARCAPATCCTSAGRSRPPRRDAPISLPEFANDWRIGVLYGPHGAPDFFTRRRHRNLLRNLLEGSLQFQPHRRPADRPQARVGAARWRRGGPASIEHSRQRLCHRRGRFHRRHAGDSRPRRPQPRRLRLSGRHCRCRALEDGPASRRAIPFVSFR